MTAMIHSVAVFRGQAASAGLPQAGIDAAVNGGIVTMSRLAFCSAYVPGQQNDQAFTQALTATLGGAPPLGQLAAWRQLHFVSHTLAVAAVRAQADTGSETLVRAIPALEREERYRAQVARLPSLDLTGELEASHQLLDMAQHQFDQNALSYIHPER